MGEIIGISLNTVPFITVMKPMTDLCTECPLHC